MHCSSAGTRADLSVSATSKPIVKKVKAQRPVQVVAKHIMQQPTSKQETGAEHSRQDNTIGSEQQYQYLASKTQGTKPFPTQLQPHDETSEQRSSQSHPREGLSLQKGKRKNPRSQPVPKSQMQHDSKPSDAHAHASVKHQLSGEANGQSLTSKQSSNASRRKSVKRRHEADVDVVQPIAISGSRNPCRQQAQDHAALLPNTSGAGASLPATIQQDALRPHGKHHEAVASGTKSARLQHLDAQHAGPMPSAQLHAKQSTSMTGGKPENGFVSEKERVVSSAIEKPQGKVQEVKALKQQAKSQQQQLRRQSHGNAPEIKTQKSSKRHRAAQAPGHDATDAISDHQQMHSKRARAAPPPSHGPSNSIPHHQQSRQQRDGLAKLYAAEGPGPSTQEHAGSRTKQQQRVLLPIPHEQASQPASQDRSVPQQTQLSGGGQHADRPQKAGKQKKPAGLLEQMRARLSGGHFRWLNEHLYTTTGDAALEFMSSNPAHFDDYHKVRRFCIAEHVDLHHVP